MPFQYHENILICAVEMTNKKVDNFSNLFLGSLYEHELSVLVINKNNNDAFLFVPLMSTLLLFILCVLFDFSGQNTLKQTVADLF